MMEPMSAAQIEEDSETRPDAPPIGNDGGSIEQMLRQSFSSLKASGRHQDAVAFAQMLLKSLPDSPVIWIEYGQSLKRLGMVDHAIFCFRFAATLKPELMMPALLTGHSLIEKVNGFKSATRGFCEDLDPWNTAIDDVFLAEIFNLGLDLFDAGFYEECIQCHGNVLRYRPKITQSLFMVSMSHLSLHQFDLAGEWLMRWYEQSVEKLNLNIWHGEDLQDKALLVYADHGLGDTMQFLSIVRHLAKQCKRLIFRVPPTLTRILGDQPNIEIVTGVEENYDYVCSLFVLPHVGGFKPDSIPREAPYLSVESKLVAKWKKRLPKDGFRIGIAWQGSPGSMLDIGRSIPVAKYAPIARIPGVSLISLQMHYGLDQLNALPEGMEIITMDSDFNAGPDNVVDTAAVMKNLDLIISTDTSVPHIAGALGVPVWTLLRTRPDWRWLKDSEDTPWYPTMRLFRQKTEGDWDEVVERVVQELTKLMAKKKRRKPPVKKAE